MQAWENGMGDIGMIKGGACLVALARRGRCRPRSRSPGHQRPRGLPERRGGRNSKYIANRGITRHDMMIRSARRALTRYYTLQTKGGNIQGWIPGVMRIPNKGKEGESSKFIMLGACDRWTNHVFGFVGFFWATFMYKVFPSELRLFFYEFLKV